MSSPVGDPSALAEDDLLGDDWFGDGSPFESGEKLAAALLTLVAAGDGGGVRAVRVTLLAQALFFLGWAGYQEWRVASAPTLMLETLPVDPRDLIAGQYLALRYPIGQVEMLAGFTPPYPQSHTEVAVLLKPGRQVFVGGKGFQIWEAARCQVPPPPDLHAAEGVWVVGDWLSFHNTVYGIERYYFSQKRLPEMANIRSGRVYVRVQVGKGGRLSLKDLVY